MENRVVNTVNMLASGTEKRVAERSSSSLTVLGNMLAPETQPTVKWQHWDAIRETTETPPAPSSTEKNEAAKPTSSRDVKNTSLSYSILSGSTMTQKAQVSQNPPVAAKNKDTLTTTDELAFEFNSKGLSISGEQDQQQTSDDAITPDYVKLSHRRCVRMAGKRFLPGLNFVPIMARWWLIVDCNDSLLVNLNSRLA